MQEIAPGVMVPGNARRVLYRGDPGEAEYLAAQQEVKEIRSELARLRGRLQALGRVETEFWFDSTAVAVAGSITLAIGALYRLEDGERSFAAKAERRAALWADAEANPDRYKIEEGKHGR